MKAQVFGLIAAVAASAALAADAPKQSGQQILFTSKTASGQPIAPISGPIQVTATISELKPGESTPVHKHPYLRYDYVLEGRISVKNLVTGKVDVVGPGQFVVDPINQWHQGTPLDGKPVRLLIIDQAPIGKSNLILKDAK